MIFIYIPRLESNLQTEKTDFRRPTYILGWVAIIISSQTSTSLKSVWGQKKEKSFFCKLQHLIPTYLWLWRVPPRRRTRICRDPWRECETGNLEPSFWGRVLVFGYCHYTELDFFWNYTGGGRSSEPTWQAWGDPEKPSSWQGLLSGSGWPRRSSKCHRQQTSNPKPRKRSKRKQSDPIPISKKPGGRFRRRRWRCEMSFASCPKTEAYYFLFWSYDELPRQCSNEAPLTEM